MKDKIIGILIIIIQIILIAVFGVRIYIQAKNDMNRGPAVYDIERIVLEPEFEKYNIINEKGQIIAILNLQLEDFQHDFQ